jgi:hypothetical protein
LKLSADEAKVLAQFIDDATKRNVRGWGVHTIGELRNALDPYYVESLE